MPYNTNIMNAEKLFMIVSSPQSDDCFQAHLILTQCNKY